MLSAAFTFSPGLAAWGTYARDRLLDGALWTLATAHWVHLSASHLALNLAALALLMGLSARWIGGWRLLAALHGGGFLLLVALAWRRPEFAWYAGLSGALHGVAAYAAMLLVSATRSRRAALALAGGIALWLAIKLGMEIAWQPASADLHAQQFTSIAHLYGVVCGVVWALAETAARRVPALVQPPA